MNIINRFSTRTKRIFTIGLFAALLCPGLPACAAEADAAVRGLIERIAPGHGRDFVVETIAAPAGENVFEVEARGGKIVLRGDGPLSQAVAFNWYLKHDAYVDVSWYADDAVNVPARLPMPPEKIRRTTKLENRFFLNYCTFGYTMPFWRWRDWERCIDWMALNGINLPLAQNGNEYIWQKVWREYGLSDEEIRAFFTGPAYLPWHRMVNIDKWEGPLPQSFIDGQHDLQKRILARERDLGMKPVLCAFAGHVPEALKARQPAMKLERIPPGWGGFSGDYGCWFLNPLDPKFNEIQVRFLQEQQKEYGTSHYYGTDPFNEITPPSWEPSYLAGVARAIYGGMAQVDPDAVWLQMAWTFQTRGQWTDDRLSAMIVAVPQGRMVLIDYVCENRELFRETRSFYGAPFIWDYLGNFGGNTFLVGPLNKINRRVTAAMNDPALTNFMGVGATLEGLNNPVVYEMLFDRVWAGTNLDLAAWVRDEACARANGTDTNVEQAWEILRANILVDNVNPIGNHGVVFQERPTLSAQVNSMRSARTAYRNEDLVRAWELLLQAGPAARKSSAYQRDLVDTTRQAMGNIGLTLRDEMAAAYDRKDAVAFKKAAGQFMVLGRDSDKFLGTRTEFMLGKWIGDAKSWAATKDEQVYYEKDARSIITIWGGTLTDYARREWNGLMSDYYLPRWQLLIDAALAELQGEPPLDLPALEKQWREHNLKFATTAGGHYATKPHGDFFAMSRALYKKYAPLTTSGLPPPTH
ncbi:MAG: alpha-N-acetylglucosaminidase [Verrucomicrobiota bacterium]|jgi:alpha-N-acetylglucosaminidase